MEKLLQLPQIRISLLEQAITTRKNKKNLHKKSPTSYLQVPLIEGLKPSYLVAKQSGHILLHGYLKCGCKNQHSCSPHKHQYLHRKFGNQLKLVNSTKCKTQNCQIGIDLFNQTHRSNKKKQQYFTKYVSKQLNQTQLKNKVKTIISKISATLKEKIFTKYGLSMQNQQIMKIIHQKITYQYLKKQNSIVNNQMQLIKQLQKYLQNKKIIKIYSHNNKQKTNNSKSLKKQNKNNLEKQNSSHKNELQRMKNYKIQQAKFEDPTKQQELQKQYENLINIFIGHNSDQLKNQYFNNIINAGDQQFQEQTDKLKEIMQKYGNKSRLRKQIVSTIMELMQKIKSSTKSSQQKKMKLHALNKLFKVSINVPIEEQQKEQSQSKFNIYKQKSRRVIKTNKSLKTLRHFTYYEQNPSEDQNYKQKQNTRISIGVIDEQRDENKNQDNITNEIITKSPSNKTHLLSIRTSVINQSDYINEGLEQIKELKSHNRMNVRFQQSKMSQKNIHKTAKKITRKHATHKFQNPFKDQQLANFDQQEKAPQQIQNQNTTVLNLTQQNPNQSNFKIQHRQRLKNMKNKVKLQRNAIKQFMVQNKDIIKRGSIILKNSDLKNFIITENDTLLMKKKKLRFLKQKLNEKNFNQGGSIQQKMMNQILKYIDLYEIQCQLILFKGRKNKKSEDSYEYRERERQTMQKLIKNNAFTDQLKFIKLSQDYFYGEEEQNQMNFNGPARIIQQIEIDRNELNPKQKVKSSPDYMSKNFKDLLQKQIPQLGHEQQIKVQFNELITKSKINFKNDNKLYNKIRRVIKQTKEETCKLIKSSRFLLTQNWNSSLDMSIMSKLNEN